MLQRGSFFLFSLERYEREAQAIRAFAGVIIAAEDPPYVGRIHLGADHVHDLSGLIVVSSQAQRILDELQRIGEAPGTEIKREHGELFILFDDPAITERRTTIVFSRKGYRTSFVRKTDRYESELREFVAEQAARQRQSAQ